MHKVHRFATVFSAVFAACLLSSSTAFSTTITFSDRNAWTAAVGGGATTVEFDGMSLMSEAWWYAGTTSVGSTTFSSNGGDLWVLTPTFYGGGTYRTSDYLLWNPLYDEEALQLVGETLTIDLGAPVRAAGWDFGTLDGRSGNFLFGVGGDYFSRLSSVDSYAFFGILSDTPFSQITLASMDFGLYEEGAMGTIDNFSTPAPVPEPSSILLFMLGGAAFPILRRKFGPVR